jgi:hypothetical protein
MSGGQSLTPGRAVELYDLLADLLGAIVGRDRLSRLAYLSQLPRMGPLSTLPAARTQLVFDAATIGARRCRIDLCSRQRR